MQRLAIVAQRLRIDCQGGQTIAQAREFGRGTDAQLQANGTSLARKFRAIRDYVFLRGYGAFADGDAPALVAAFMSSDANFAVHSSSSLPPRARPRPLSLPEQMTAQTILAAKQTVTNVFADPLLRAALFDRGYDDAEIRAGATLQTAAESEFVNCQLALGARDAAADAFAAVWTTTREEYMEFRGVVRRLFAESVCVNAFRVGGQIEPQLGEFVAQALTSYAMALGSPSLAEQGYDTERLCAATAELKQLLELDIRLQTIDAALKRQLDNRDLAVAMYNVWVRALIQQVRLVSGIALHPPWLREIPAANPVDDVNDSRRSARSRFDGDRLAG